MEAYGDHEERDTLKMTASSALRHPMRIRILEVVNERDMSPIEFMNQGLAPKLDNSQMTLSHVSYHFRQLAEDGCLEVVDRVPRRGATEHVYRGRARAFFDDEDWEQLPPRERRLFSRAIYQGMAACAEGAMLAGTFDSRPDRHLTWVTMEVDERGWKELMASLLDCFDRVERIRREAKQRLESSGDEGVPTTVGLLGFEAAEPPRSQPVTSERPVIASG